jgi:2'-5' RNA ligase
MIFKSAGNKPGNLSSVKSVTKDYSDTMRHLYLLALLPPKELSAEIHEIRLECAKKFGVQKALRPPVHITLYRPFHAEQAFEDEMIRLLEQGTRGISSFTQNLENFGTFKSQVVFIKALTNPELIQLHEALVSVIRHNRLDKQLDEQKDQPFHPHITIAYRDIPAELFPAIWAEYKDRQVKYSFKADHFTLLKHENSKWNPIKDFKLSPEVEQKN